LLEEGLAREAEQFHCRVTPGMSPSLIKASKGLSDYFYWRNLPNLQFGDNQMVTKTKNRKTSATKNRFIGKPKGQVQDRVKAVRPEHFGVVTVDCAKRRSKEKEGSGA
jgi:hypothetical protein